MHTCPDCLDLKGFWDALWERVRRGRDRRRRGERKNMNMNMNMGGGEREALMERDFRVKRGE
jgi:hypothetical protein